MAGTTFQNVNDDFHKSLSLLKDPYMSTIESTPAFQETVRDFSHILKLVEQGGKILAIKAYEAVDQGQNLDFLANSLQIFLQFCSFFSNFFKIFPIFSSAPPPKKKQAQVHLRTRRHD